MTARNVLLALHIALAVAVIGPLVLFDLVAPALVRKGREALPVLRWIHGSSRVLGPAVSLVFLLGIVLVLRDGKDATQFGDTWVWLAMLLLITAAVNGAVFIARTLETIIAKTDTGQAVAAETSRLSLLGALNVVIMLTITYLMVAKPGWV